MSKTVSEASERNFKRVAAILLPVLAVALLILFYKSFEPDLVLHNNDTPVGAMENRADSFKLFSGSWHPKNWLGAPSASTQLIDLALLSSIGRVAVSKFYAPLSLLGLGIAAAYFFRKLGFSRFVCVLGGLAAALNGNMLSNAAWGQYSRALTLTAAFLALAALVDGRRKHILVRTILAGFAVGMGIIHGFDIGALFSLYIATFVVFQALFESSENKAKSIGIGLGSVALVAICAAIISANTLVALVGTQIKGVSGMKAGEETKIERWDFATQWSLPKIETFRVIIPGLYGYRMDTPGGGQYWGRVGQDPRWEREHIGSPRGSSGAGEYAGVLVVLVAAYSLAQALRKTGPFSQDERKTILFWSIVAFVSVLLAWGRFAPFYQFIYKLPYFSTIRNPIKFMHPVHMILIILFGYGLQALWRQYLAPTIPRAGGFSAQWKKWWASASDFDHKWIYGLAVAIFISFAGLLIYSSSTKSVVNDLAAQGFQPELATMTVKFSVREVLLFIVFLVASSLAIAAIMSGWFSGPRAKMAGILLGVLLVVDLARSNTPWIIYYDTAHKYASNPIIDMLRDKPYEGRVTFANFIQHPDVELFGQLYGIEWAQQLFPYYGVHSIDVIQMPREPVDFAAYRGAKNGAFSMFNVAAQVRYWELTGTRYILGPAFLADAINSQLDQNRNRFRVKAAFDLAPKPGVTQARSLEDITAVLNPKGRLALIEFTGALPRVKLFSDWQVITNDDLVVTNSQVVTTNGVSMTNLVAVTNSLTLNKLKDPQFDPHKTVLLGNEVRVSQPASPEQSPGSAEITYYSTKEIDVTANASVPSVLLLNDRFDPNWKVYVDGKQEPLLRANYLMRGVHLPAGNHKVEFRLEPKATALYVTLAAVAVGIVLCGYLAVASRREQKA